MVQRADQVWETSQFTGTGNVTALTAVVKSFNTAFGTGGTDVFRYYIRNRTVPGEFERGTGHLSDSTTLVRDTVEESSNGGAAVNFSAGLKDVTSDDSVDEIPDLDTLASTANGDGASLIGIEDSGGNFSGSTVEAALSELASGSSLGLERDLRLAFLLIAENAGDRVNMVDGIADPFTDETDVDTATSTNEVYDAAGDYYNGATSSVAADGNPTANPGLDRSGYAMRQRIEAAAITGNGPTCTVELIAHGSNDLPIDQAYIGQAASSGNNWDFDGNQVQITFDGGNSGTTVSAGTTVVSDDISFSIDDTEALIVAFDILTGGDYRPKTEGTKTNFSNYQKDTSGTDESDQTAPTGYSASNDVQGVGEIVIKSFNNVTLVSNAFTADSAPDTARVHVQVSENESITVNTDLTAEVSRDGGTSWTTATLVAVETLADGTVAYEDSSVDISGQPSGTSMKYRIKTLNNKDIEIHGVLLQWD